MFHPDVYIYICIVYIYIHMIIDIYIYIHDYIHQHADFASTQRKNNRLLLARVSSVRFGSMKVGGCYGAGVLCGEGWGGAGKCSIYVRYFLESCGLLYFEQRLHNLCTTETWATSPASLHGHVLGHGHGN